ncbi:MAG: BamA/TamA family outer membrane protein, partial [bacterium]
MIRYLLTIICLLGLLAAPTANGQVDTVACAGEGNIYLCAEQVILALADSGYCAAQAEIVSVAGVDKLLLDRGALFSLAQLKLDGVADSLISLLNLEQLANLPLTRQNRDAILSQLVLLLAENGYPFAQLTIAAEFVENDTLYLDCSLLSGPHTRIGAVRYEGLEVTRPSTLAHRHKLRVGEWYRESEVRAAGESLRQVEFCTLLDSPRLRFDSRSDQVEIIFPMRDRRSFRLDGGLLVLPDRSLAGNLELSAQNLLGAGRRFGLSWDRKDSASRRLRLDFGWPYVGALPFDLELRLSQEERDSVFVTTNASAALSYHAGSHWLTGVGFNWQKTTPPEGNRVPSARSYGLELTSTYDCRDDRYDPRSGFWLQFGFGSRYRKSFSVGDSLSSGYGSTVRADFNHWLKVRKGSSVYSRLQLFQVTSDFEPLPVEELI